MNTKSLDLLKARVDRKWAKAHEHRGIAIRHLQKGVDGIVPSDTAPDTTYLRTALNVVDELTGECDLYEAIGAWVREGHTFEEIFDLADQLIVERQGGGWRPESYTDGMKRAFRGLRDRGWL